MNRARLNSRVLLAWDFDWTLVDQNSDPWVVKNIGAKHLFKKWLSQIDDIGFTNVMHNTLQEAHTELHYTVKDIYEACISIPIDSNLIKIVQRLGGLVDRVTSVIISDANSVFIDNILKHHSCLDCFGEVFTNNAVYAASGALAVHPYAQEPHGCPLCPSNLCKGQVLDKLLKQDSFDRVVYIGDGNGDYCPCTRLRSSDVVLPRSSYPKSPNESTPLLARLTEAPALFQLSTIPPSSAIFSGQSLSDRVVVYPWRDQAQLASWLETCLYL